MLDPVVLAHAQRLENFHETFLAEQTHQIVLQRDVELRFARIALTAGTAAQLVVDSSGLVALRADNLQAAGGSRLIVQLDIGASAGHVRGDGHGAVMARIRDDLRLELMVFGI